MRRKQVCRILQDKTYGSDFLEEFKEQMETIRLQGKRFLTGYIKYYKESGNDRPQVAWELIVEEINRYMKVNRKRETYRYVPRLLGSARKIPGKSEKVRESILFLYNAQPRLPALRDEFTKAGIV